MEFNKRHNTAGTAEIHACGDMNPIRDSAQEAHKSLVYGQFIKYIKTQITTKVKNYYENKEDFTNKKNYEVIKRSPDDIRAYVTYSLYYIIKHHMNIDLGIENALKKLTRRENYDPWYIETEFTTLIKNNLDKWKQDFEDYEKTLCTDK